MQLSPKRQQLKDLAERKKEILRAYRTQIEQKKVARLRKEILQK